MICEQLGAPKTTPLNITVASIDTNTEHNDNMSQQRKQALRPANEMAQTATNSSKPQDTSENKLKTGKTMGNSVKTLKTPTLDGKTDSGDCTTDRRLKGFLMNKAERDQARELNDKIRSYCKIERIGKESLADILLEMGAAQKLNSLGRILATTLIG